MLRVFLFLACAFSVSNADLLAEKKTGHYPFYNGPVNEEPVASIHSENGDIIVVSDSLPLFYYQDIATEVCHDHLCKPAFIRIFWDTSASFLGFQIQKNTPLTKAEHLEFSEYDYYLLYSILNNPYSILGEMAYEELTSVKKNTSNNIDGTTGATSIVDKNAVVAGAVFTCYTLWAIVNDTSIINGIQDYSLRLMPGEMDLKKSLHPKHLHSGQLALLMLNANSERKLRKNKYQKTVSADLNHLKPLSSLIINNYLLRQVFVFPEIEQRLSNCSTNVESFNKMLNHEN